MPKVQKQYKIQVKFTFMQDCELKLVSTEY